MTQAELVNRARAGKLIVTVHSLHRPDVSGTWLPREVCQHDSGWRTVACDKTSDVVEYPRCGQQRVASCNFGDEYA